MFPGRMQLYLNGHDREFPELDSDATLPHLIKLMQLKADRVAVERNGEIMPRVTWPQVELKAGDKLEVVQFVGGGQDVKKTLSYS